jgi:predicted Zn finger-like uncharacterized protein
MTLRSVLLVAACIAVSSAFTVNFPQAPSHSRSVRLFESVEGSAVEVAEVAAEFAVPVEVAEVPAPVDAAVPAPVDAAEVDAAVAAPVEVPVDAAAPAPVDAEVAAPAEVAVPEVVAPLTEATYVRCGKCQTSFVATEEDLGGARGKGRRLECSVCGHSWFQSRDRLMTMRDGFEMIPLPSTDKERIANNIKEGKEPKFMGDFKLYVGNIAFSCHENDLIEVFSQVGVVGEVSLVRDDDGKIRGFGFITMRTAEDGQRAIDELDGKPVRGRNIAVRESNN